MATPWGRPFSHSSMCDSVHTLVPCARQVTETEQSKRERLKTRKDMWLKSTNKGESPLIREHGAVSHSTFADLGYGLVNPRHGEALGLRPDSVARGYVQHLGERQRAAGIAAAEIPRCENQQRAGNLQGTRRCA